jgi:hypothetical protein
MYLPGRVRINIGKKGRLLFQAIIKDYINLLIHEHTYIYIYMYECMFIRVCIRCIHVYMSKQIYIGVKRHTSNVHIGCWMQRR